MPTAPATAALSAAARPAHQRTTSRRDATAGAPRASTPAPNRTDEIHSVLLSDYRGPRVHRPR